MEISDLRSYLEVLRGNGQLITVDRPVDLRFELANILISLENRGLPAALFTSVGGLGIPVVGSLLSTQKRVALALGCREGEVVEYLLRAMERPIPPEEVSRPAFHENTWTEEADLLKLPIPVHSEGDGGAFISGAAVFSKDPRTGRQNISFQRFQLKGPKKLGIKAGETTKDGKVTLKDAECQAACDLGPALQVNALYHGNMTPEKFDKLLEALP
jgi:UbiD family decarboxylase